MGLGRLFGRKDSASDAPEPEVGAGPERPPITVVVIDDEPEARDFLRASLETGGFAVVGEAGDGPTAVAAVAEGRPDLVLVDLHMPDVGGLELLPQLREVHWPTKFVVVSAIGATAMVDAAIEAGVVGYIEKGVSPRTLNLHLEKIAGSGTAKIVRPFPLNHEYP